MIEHIYVGFYGQPIDILVLKDDEAWDISWATTRTLRIKDASGDVTTTAVSFKTDGTDGYVRWVPGATDLDEAGSWALQLVLEGASQKVPITPIQFTVQALL